MPRHPSFAVIVRTVLRIGLAISPCLTLSLCLNYDVTTRAITKKYHEMRRREQNMKKGPVIFLAVLLTVVLALPAFGHAATTPPAGNPVKIGGSLPLTGIASEPARWIKAGDEYWAQDVLALCSSLPQFSYQCSASRAILSNGSSVGLSCLTDYALPASGSTRTITGMVPRRL